MDLLLRHALVFDGLGSAPQVRSVGVLGGRIVVLDDDDVRADEVVDLKSLALAPGFIDVHSHSDTSYAVDPLADSKIRQGVTTEVIGNCGMSPAILGGDHRAAYRRGLLDRHGVTATWTNFQQYFSHIEAIGMGTNCVALLGHGDLRSTVVGDDDRRPTEAEMARMQTMTDQALAHGVWGLSTGLIYVPSVYADLAELVALSRRVRQAGGCYTSHIRGEGDTLEAAVAEAIAVGRDSGALVEVSHHKASGLGNWGKVHKTLGMMEAARQAGVRVYCDQYPYVASSTGLDAVLPLWALEGGHAATVERLRQPDSRERIRQAVQQHPHRDWTRVMVADVNHGDGPNRRFVGQHVQHVADVLHKSPEDAVMDLLIEEGGEVGAIYFSMSDEDVEAVLQSPWTVIGSDAGGRSVDGPLSSGHPHPRTYGTFPRVLGHYVREQGLLPLASALHRMCGMPADRFGLAGRGRIEVGCGADLVAFDPQRIVDRATFVEPQQYPDGIEHVWVNGTAVVRHGEPTRALPGRVLRLGQDGRIDY